MNRNSLTAVIMAAALFGGCLVGCGLMGENKETLMDVEPDFVLCYGEVNSEGHIMTDSAQFFADKVKELSGGKVIIELYPSGQLGDDARCYQAMQMGALDLYRGNSSSLAECGNPMVTVLALPYIFRDREHFWKVCNSELGARILEDIQSSCEGMIGLAYLDEGARHFFTTSKPITRLSDMKGLIFRMQDSDVMIDTASALGAMAIPINYVELYSALQAGTVDGAENPASSYWSNKFYEVAPYYVMDGHTHSPGVLMASEITWNQLGEEYQQILRQAASLTQEYNEKQIEKAEKRAYESLKAVGVKITEVQDRQAWSDAMEPVYQKYGAQFLDLLKEIQNMY